MLKNNPQSIEIKKKFDREGYFSPLNIFSEDEIDHYINELNHIDAILSRLLHGFGILLGHHPSAQPGSGSFGVDYGWDPNLFVYVAHG